jgi:uncharacterized protein
METIELNSREMIQKRADTGLVNWKWPLAIVFARLFFALLVQSLVAMLFFSTSSLPYKSAGEWWPVYGSLIDLGCFILVMWQIKKEGLRFRDLVNFDQHRIGRDVLIGLGFILWVFPLAIVGITAFSLLIFGRPQPPSVYSPLPVWAVAYSLLIFPIIWGVMEQCTYQGYALPRLDALFPRSGVAIAIVAFGWGIQHIALPLVLDRQYMLYRFLSFLPLAVVMSLVYLRTRRLIPFIIAHWAVDMLGVLSGIVIPMLMK